MTIEEIIKNYLKENGFDGLCCDACGNGCSIDDMPLCGSFEGSCVPAYKHEKPETCLSDCKMGCFENVDIDETVFCAHPVRKPE